MDRVRINVTKVNVSNVISVCNRSKSIAPGLYKPAVLLLGCSPHTQTKTHHVDISLLAGYCSTSRSLAHQYFCSDQDTHLED